MNEYARILWIGNRDESREAAESVEKDGYEVSIAADLNAAMEILRNEHIDLIVLENETSCIQGELVSVRLKGVAPKVPILLLCEPLASGAPQAFFVNLILSLKAAPELLLRSIYTLVPRQSSRKTGT
jgi:DNA-binding NtrC family response regulator